MNYEVIAVVKIARDDHGIYSAVLDFSDGGAPESLTGFSTLEGLLTRAARLVAATLKEVPDAGP